MTIDHDSKNNDEFRQSMIEYLKIEFTNFLGEDVKLLDLDNGLDLIKEKYGIDFKGGNQDVA